MELLQREFICTAIQFRLSLQLFDILDAVIAEMQIAEQVRSAE